MSATVVGKSSELLDLRVIARLAQIFDAGVYIFKPKCNTNRQTGRTCLTNAANGFRKLAWKDGWAVPKERPALVLPQSYL
jgi:hypothetical protein